MESGEIFWRLVEENKLDKYKNILQKNGFEDWETLEEINEEILNELGKTKKIFLNPKM